MRFQHPVKNCFITSEFDEPRNYSFAPLKLQLHEGIDYAPAWEDSSKEFEIYAAQIGVVTEIGYDKKGYGHYVKIKHSPRYSAYYAHLKKKSLLEVDDLVTIETVLGYMGASGNSTGKHLHFSLQDFFQGLSGYVVAKVIDPLPLMINRIDTCIIPYSCYNYVSRLLTL